MANSDWQVFPNRVPWIPTTPATRHPVQQAETPVGLQNKEFGPKIPPLATFPPMPSKEEPLTEEEKKKLSHLRGLKTMNVQLPKELEDQLTELEVKETEMNNSKALSHGHLNRLTKIKTQISAQSKKIAALDQEWTAFVQNTMQKVSQHAELYQQCRGEMMELYNQKLEELRKLKYELTLASRSLVDQHVEEPPQEDLEPVDLQMDRMRTALAAAGSVTQVQELSDEDDEMITAEGEVEFVKDSKAVTKPNFKAAASPQKVVQMHLKHKKDKQEK